MRLHVFVCSEVVCVCVCVVRARSLVDRCLFVYLCGAKAYRLRRGCSFVAKRRDFPTSLHWNLEQYGCVLSMRSSAVLFIVTTLERDRMSDEVKF